MQRKLYELTIVIPLFNEQDIFPFLKDKLTELFLHDDKTVIILVDDGSTDSTRALIREWTQATANVTGIILSRNFGQQAAIGAGIDAAESNYVGIMDADLQDSPEELNNMLQLAKEHDADIVYAKRKSRKAPFFKKICYDIFYQIYNFFSDFPVHDNSGDFSIMSKKAMHIFRELPERVRFNRGLRAWIGLKTIMYETNRTTRFAGEPKYTLWKLIALAFEGIVSTSTKPLRLSFILGLLLCMSAFVLIGIYIFLYFTTELSTDVPGFATVITLILVLNGFQFLLIGILGEYIGTIFKEVKRRPQYIVDEIYQLHG